MVNYIKKRHHGDRKDAYLVKNLDPLHSVMNYILGQRVENEAVSKIELDTTALTKYLANKNKDIDPKIKYTLFHAVLTALARTLQERKELNYFVRDKKIYERKIISLCYVAKRLKEDGAEENIVIQEYHPESDLPAIKQIHDKAVREVSAIRESDSNNTESADLINKFLQLPGFILKPIAAIIRRLDKKGRLPYSIAKDIPYYSTVFISNLGSIKFNATYHHLTNFGTNSIFLIIGEKHLEPCYNPDGTYEMREYLPISFTLDERIADGVYFAKSLKLMQALLLKPELLDLPSNEIIDFESLYNEIYGNNNDSKN